MAKPPSDFRATVETYSGPLDLLLYLIRKEEVDVFDIPVSMVIGQYHKHLEFLREIDPNVSGDFLVMAARLMEIKSKLLLPREVLDEEDEEYEDPRLELVKQLLEYKKFKERALLLEKKLAAHKKRYTRPIRELEDDALDVAEFAPAQLQRAARNFNRAVRSGALFTQRLQNAPRFAAAAAAQFGNGHVMRQMRDDIRRVLRQQLFLGACHAVFGQNGDHFE